MVKNQTYSNEAKSFVEMAQKSIVCQCLESYKQKFNLVAIISCRPDVGEAENIKSPESASGGHQLWQLRNFLGK